MKSKQTQQDAAGNQNDASRRADDEANVTSEHEDASAEENQDTVLEAEIVTESTDAANASDESADADEDAPNKEASKPDPKDTQINELTQQLLRTRADFDNFRRRTRQEKEDLRQYATKKLLEELLPVVDNFERALDATAGDGDTSEVKAGIEMVHKQLLDALKKHGVEPMEVVDQPFDPKVHEAVMQEAAEGKESGIVLAELQKGYMLHNQVLRPAMVKVTS